jgi:alpha-N-arabinofuranosidase
MKHLNILSSALLALLLLVGALSGCAGSADSDNDDTAHFRYFRYTGNDRTGTLPLDTLRQYRNPILSGFYPDPSLCRKADDYYLVLSSFAYYPGIPIFHSLDLVHWRQIGHVLNRPSQLALDDGLQLSGGVYAPSITYNPHNEQFYLINTCVGSLGNFVVKTRDPMQQNWSEPIALPKVGGIDPSLFFDDDGQAYLVHNDAPAGEPEWDGHRAIRLHRYDVEADTTFDDSRIIVDGGTDKARHPIWIEAPHLYKIDGRYYLMCAEGGTSTGHSEVIFRSDHVLGPYLPWAHNPILTQRDLPADRPDPVTCAGHADLIQTPAGDWYAVFLACRPYEDGHYNTGRETFLLPVHWTTDGYPVILPRGERVPYIVDKSDLRPPHDDGAGDVCHTGNFAWNDDFLHRPLNDRWLFIRTPRSDWWSFVDGGGLSLRPNGHTVYERSNPSFIGSRQQHLSFEVQTELSYRPADTTSLAGLVCYQNERYNLVFGQTLNASGQPCLVLDAASHGQVLRLAETPLPPRRRAPLTLKIVGQGAHYSFYASFDRGATWTTIYANADGRILSTHTAGGFTGVVIGMYVQ